ncbi:hypothetical protein FOL47_011379, partial [Perkinsus chesapeaki]
MDEDHGGLSADPGRPSIMRLSEVKFTPAPGSVLSKTEDNVSTHVTFHGTAPPTASACSSSLSGAELPSEGYTAASKSLEQIDLSLGVADKDDKHESTFVFQVDEYKRQKWLKMWASKAAECVKVADFSFCRDLQDSTEIVGKMWHVIDLDSRRSSLTDYNPAITLNLVSGCSGVWDIDFEQLKSSTGVCLSEDMNAFPLQLVSGIHISKLIEMMYSEWKRIAVLPSLSMSRKEVNDTEEAFELLINNYPAVLRNKLSFKSPESVSLRTLPIGEVYNLTVLMETIASSNRSSNVVPKTAVTLLRGLLRVYGSLPPDRKSYEGLVEMFKQITGGQAVPPSSKQYLKALVDTKRCRLDMKVLDEMARCEASISTFDQGNMLCTTFNWEVITSLFRVDWSKSLAASEARSRVRGIVDTLHEFFISEKAFLLHKMIGDSSLLKSNDGTPFVAEALRSHMLSVVAAALAEMKLACLLWMIFKAHPNVHRAILSLPHEAAEGILERLRSKDNDIAVVTSTYGMVFSEGVESDACCRPLFEGINPSEIITPAKAIMAEIYSLKNREAQKQEIIRSQREQAEQEQHLALIAEAERQRKAASDELKRMKLAKMTEDQSKFDLMVQQSIESTLSAFEESEKKCSEYKKQVEADLRSAADDILAKRVFVADCGGGGSSKSYLLGGSRMSLDGARAGTARHGDGSLVGTPVWIQEGLRSLRPLLCSAPPDFIYVDLADDKYLNGSDFGACTIPLAPGDIELFVRELMDSFQLVRETTIILRAPTASPTCGVSSTWQLLGAFSARKEKENNLPSKTSSRLSDDGSTVRSVDSAEASLDASDSIHNTDSNDEKVNDGNTRLHNVTCEEDQTLPSKRICYRTRSFWDMGYPLEISLKDQFLVCWSQKLNALRKRDRQAAEARLIGVPIAQENLFFVRRCSKGGPGRKRQSTSTHDNKGAREMVFSRFYNDNEKKALMIAQKVDPLGAGSSDFTVKTFEDLFGAVGMHSDSKLIVMAPGENNCNSVITAAGRIGCTVILPLRVAKLDEYEALHTALVTGLTEGLRERRFPPLKKLPVRPVTEEINFLLGARRQAILLLRGKPMTREEEREFEVQVLNISEILVPVHHEVKVTLDAWKEDPLEEVNTRLRRLENDTTLQTMTQKAFDNRITAITKNDATWLYLKVGVEEGEEVFRLDGFIHCSTRSDSVVDVICARTGQTKDDAVDRSKATKRKTYSDKTDQEQGARCRTRHSFPPHGWGIFKVSYFMPMKTYDWSKQRSSSNEDEGAVTADDGGLPYDIARGTTTRSGSVVHGKYIECGKLFFYGCTDD